MQKHKRALQKNLSHFLVHYRRISRTTTGKTLAEIMFGRNIKTRMDLLHPQSNERHSTRKVKSDASFGKNARELEVGDAVWMQDYRNSSRWIPGSITPKFGPQSYLVPANGKFYKRHIDQLRSHSLETLEDATYSIKTSRMSTVTNKKTSQCHQSYQGSIFSGRTEDLQTD